MVPFLLVAAYIFLWFKCFYLSFGCILAAILYSQFPKIKARMQKEKEYNDAINKQDKEKREAQMRQEKEWQKKREKEEERERAERERKEAEETRKKAKEKREKEKYKDYKYCILVLLAKVMNADGDNMKCELDRVKSTIRRYYQTKEEQAEALNTFKSILDDKSFFSIWGTLNTQFDYTAKSELIMELLAVAYSDNNLKYSEEKEILNIVSQLRINQEEYRSIYSIFIEKYKQGFYKDKEEEKADNEEKKEDKRKDYDGDSHRSNKNSSDSKNTHRQTSSKEKDAYTILGVEESASDEEIKKAYRALAVKCHPDNAATLGDEAIRQATETMKQINAAWEVVKEKRGMK